MIVIETKLTGLAASVQYVGKNLCLSFEVLCPPREQARTKHRQQIVQTEMQSDADDPQGCVARLVDALAPGSHVVVSHMTSDMAEDGIATMSRRMDERMRTSNPPAVRDRAGVAAVLDGLALVEPGIVPVNQWHPDAGGSTPDRGIPIVGAVGRRR